MKETDLKYPGPLSDSQRLRRLVALNISRAELAAKTSPDSDTPTVLKQFLEDAAAKCPGESSVTPAPATETTVANGDEFTDATGTYKFTVAGGEITAVTFTPV